MDHIWRSTVMPGDHQWKEGFSSSDNPKMGPVVSRATEFPSLEKFKQKPMTYCQDVIEERRSISWVLEVDPLGSSALEGAWFNVLVSSLVCVRCDWRILVAKPGAHPQSANQENYKRRRPETSEWIVAALSKGNMASLKAFWMFREL